MAFVDELQSKIAAASGVVHVRDDDEVRLETKCLEAARRERYNLWRWTYSDGLEPVSQNVKLSQEELLRLKGVVDPIELLNTVKSWQQGPSVVIAYDLFTMANRLPTLPMAVRLVKDVTLIQQNPTAEGPDKETTNALIESATCQLVVCDEQEPELKCPLQRVVMELPDRNEMAILLRALIDTVEEDMAKDAKENGDKILNALAGLPAYQASNAISESISRKGRIDPATIRNFKKELISAKGLTYIEPEPLGFDSIGGLQPVKDWCRKRSIAFDEDLRKEYGVRPPKGALAGGKPGCAKSHFAKALAAELGMVCIRMDVGSTRGMYQGQSENQFEEAVKTAEAVAPCILHVDEAEKAFGGSQGGSEVDGGTGSRILGSFLTWLQEKESMVFVWATGNRMDQLPPEFMRAGRFDASFWFDLPTVEERQAIAEVFKKKYPKADNVDINAVVKASQNCTGAEIETSFEEAALAAMGRRDDMTTEDVVEELQKVTRVEDTFTMSPELQKWRDAAIRANAEDPKDQTDKPVSRRTRRVRRNARS